MHIYIYVYIYILFTNRDFYQKLKRFVIGLQCVDTQKQPQTMTGQSGCGLGDHKGCFGHAVCGNCFKTEVLHPTCETIFKTITRHPVCETMFRSKVLHPICETNFKTKYWHPTCGINYKTIF